MAEEHKIDDALRVAQALNLGDEEMELRFRQIVDNMGEAFFYGHPKFAAIFVCEPCL